MHRKSVYFLILSVAALIALGVVMLFSTSAFAQDAHGNPYFFIKRQLMWLGLGIVACAVAARFDYRRLASGWWFWYAISLVLLALCFAPHVGKRLNGSARWVDLRVVTFQPSELAKFAAILTLAWWFSQDERIAREFRKGFLAPLGFSGLLMALIVPEVDLGTTALIGATTYGVMFAAGARLFHLVPLALAGVAALAVAIMKMPERMGRFLAFMYPDRYPKDAYQTVQGLIALGSGGVEGLGLGNGRQKMAYLPFAHTDFIFPMVGEELGLRATLLVVFLYVIFIMSAAVIVMRARDRFGLLLGFGFLLMITIQAAVNIGVVTSLLPNKGLPLPFISYGGSNLVFCLLGVGILISIYRFGAGDDEAKGTVKLAVRTRPRLRPRPVRL